jgi:hypothetical protein
VASGAAPPPAESSLAPAAVSRAEAPIAAAPSERRKSFYRKWWFWVPIGVVVAGAGVGIGVALARHPGFDSTRPDFGPGQPTAAQVRF